MTAAKEAVARAGDAVADMGYFTAREGPPAEYCRNVVRGCDVYVGLIGLRYGSPVPDQPDVSYTELEFNTATEQALPRLVFLLADAAAPPSWLSDLQDDKPDLWSRQLAFRHRLRTSGVTTCTVTGPDQLELMLLQALLESKLDRAVPLPGQQMSQPLGRSRKPRQAKGLVKRTGLPRQGRLARRTEPNPAQIPAEPPGFSGRAPELQWLQSLLPGQPTENAENAPSCPVALITGTGGVGKTMLAIRFARLSASRFPDGQLYVNLRGAAPEGSAVAPGTALQGFFDALGVPPRQVPSPLEAKSALLRSLLDGRRMLLLLDNAHDADQVRPLLPASAGCMVVVTCRSQLTGLVVTDGAHPLTLGVLNADEAAALLAKRLGAERISAEPDAVAALSRQVAGLPLALGVICARALTQAYRPLAELAAELGDARGRLNALSTGDVATDLRAVFSWSVGKLSEQAARTFRLIGLHPGPEFTAASVASLTATPITAAHAVLLELTRASLITEDTIGRFSCHELLREYAAELAATTLSLAECALARRRVLDYYLRTAHAAAARLYPGRELVPLPTPLSGVAAEEFSGTYAYEAALSWFGAEHRLLRSVIEYAAAQHYDEHCWKLAWCWTPMLIRRGGMHELLAVQRIAIQAAERLGDRGALARVHCELGNASTRLGIYGSAEEHLQLALAVFTDLDAVANVAWVRNGFAILFSQQNQYDEALKHATEALRLHRSLDYSPSIAYAENGVGWILAHLGHPQAGLRHCSRALDMHRESGSRTGVADTLDSIAYAYGRLGDYEQAISYYREALEIYRQLGDSHNEAKSLLGLGDTYLSAGQPNDAQHTWEQALSLLEQVPGPDKDEALNRLAQIRPQAQALRRAAVNT